MLSEVVDLQFSGVDREQSAGDFRVDLVATDEQSRTIVIENQLEKSNHDHLGKLITYLTNISAAAAIWIVADPRPEHVTAINWLNQTRDAEFYLVKVEAVRIDNSPPAPLLTLIAGPSEEVQEVGDTKKEIAERHQLRRRFWTKLLERAKGKTKLHSSISPGDFMWIGTGAGIRGLGYNYVVWQHGGGAELYIDRGKGSDNENKSLFDALFADKNAIEKDFGGALEWQRLDQKRACRIRKAFEDLPGFRDTEEDWQKTQGAMIDAMMRLEKALAPRLAKLKVS